MALAKENVPRTEARRLERRVVEIDAELERLRSEREATQHRLESLRLELVMCPRCGRDADFLTDEGGVLIHVLEDSDDVELLTRGKPLYCPACGDVFLYTPKPFVAPAPMPVPVVAARRR